MKAILKQNKIQKIWDYPNLTKQQKKSRIQNIKRYLRRREKRKNTNSNNKTNNVCVLH